MMGGGIFITGTDTGVGKTFVACGLAAVLKKSGYSVGVMKPAETGCEQRDGKPIPSDAVSLKEASRCDEPLEKICPYALPEPLAPSLAAERAAVQIDIDRLINAYQEIRTRHDMTVVEGAGGLMVPLLPSYTYADFVRVLNIPILVVAANRLGAINHLLLTLEHAACKGLRVLGYVLNRIESEPSLAAETNREALLGLTGVPCAANLPYFDHSKTSEQPVLNVFDQRFDWRILEPVLSR
jgi:dethiobiotin synthetase